MFADQELLHLIWILSRKSLPRTIPSWTGFNITIRQNIPVLASSVGYLDCIDAPATDISTIYTVMERCLTIKETLKLSCIICVFDQAIYAKAVEIRWKKMERYKDCILMLGTFHTIMMYLGIIGKRFKDAGLRDILIQSEVIAEGSVDRALTGKMYNRSVRSYKLVYEALMQMLIEKMQFEMKDDLEKNNTIDHVAAKISIFSASPSQERYEDLLDDIDIQRYNSIFIDYRMNLEHTGSELCKFWLTFLDMVNLLLNTLYATRTGHWNLLLECLREIAMYAFAYDNYNYARYLPAFIGEMIALETTNPTVYSEFQNGGFAVQLSKTNTFGRVETDKVIETTVNRDTKTPGGTTGFSTNQNAVNRWSINASYRAEIRNCFHNFLGTHSQSHVHNDLKPSRIKRDEKDVQHLIEVLTETFIDPFSSNDLLCISNGVLATEEVRDDLLTAKTKGEEKMQTFINNRLLEEGKASMFDPIKKLNLGTFSKMAKIVKVPCKDKQIPLKATRSLFGQISIITQHRQFDLKEVFKYPLGPFPWALSGINGELKKTSKVALLHALEKDVEPIEEYPENYVSIVDGMALVQKVRASGLTYQQLAEQLLKSVLSISKNADRIDVVFDVYRDDSIKNAERIRRSNGKILVQNIVPSCPVKQWNQFLSTASNKTALIKFIVAQWASSPHFNNIERGKFYATVDDECMELSKDGARSIEQLRSNQEEADTRMFLHLIDGCRTYNNFVIHTPDTDVFMIAFAVSEMTQASIYVKTGCKEKTRIIGINAIKQSLKVKFIPKDVSMTEFTNALLSLHAFTGCDTVSAFTGKGKLKAMKVMCADASFVHLFTSLGNQWDLQETQMLKIEEFVCKLYGYTMNDVNLLRYKIFCSKKGNIDCEKLPPCFSSLYQHSLRANYQSRIWKLCTESNPIIPSPNSNGWKLENGDISIVWMTCKPAPEEVSLYY